MKRLEISMLFALIFTAVVSFIAFEGQCGEIRESVLRMHILANSDSKEDQELKLKVRDRLLSESDAVFESCTDLAQALDAAQRAKGIFESAAREEIKKNGFDYPVRVEIGVSRFDTREYGKVTLPAGKYEAVNVYIGSASGHNWWCVMFPQLCLSAATGNELETVLTGEQENIVEGGYKVEFYLVELWEKMMSR